MNETENYLNRKTVEAWTSDFLAAAAAAGAWTFTVPCFQIGLTLASTGLETAYFSLTFSPGNVP
jgi:hypothetical protein